MIDEMANHATRVRRYMERFGVERVESFIDVCLSLDNLIDPMSMFIQREARRPRVRQGQADAEEEQPRQFKLKAKSYMDKYINPPEPKKEPEEEQQEQEAGERQPELEKMPKFPLRPVRDVMEFLVQHAPLKPWQRDVMEIIREEAYYFAPQGMTKIMNEGWATYWHSTIMTQKVLDDGEVIDYADHAASVLGGRFLNPYKIGVELFRHIEDRWNRGRFGKEWEECDNLAAKRTWDRQLGLGREKIYQVRAIYNDVMFIDEFFTEDFCREQLFFTYGWNERNAQWEIQSRQYRQIKNRLLTMLTNFGNPFIYVEDGNFENRGELLIKHRHEGTDLRMDWARDTLVNLYKVWRRPTNLMTKVEGNGKLITFDGKEHTEKDVTVE
jgi:stage V sporulation protein R